MRWHYLDDADADAGWSEEFEDQAAAEAWLGDAWRELLARGVTCVELMEGEELVYRMGLTPD